MLEAQHLPRSVQLVAIISMVIGFLVWGIRAWQGSHFVGSLALFGLALAIVVGLIVDHRHERKQAQYDCAGQPDLIP